MRSSLGRSDVVATELLTLPHVTPPPLVLRDVEAFLLGLLENEHHLGGPVRPGPTGPFVVHDRPPAEASGVLLCDQESTPLAALTDLEPWGPTSVRGRLLPLRRRESGERPDMALSLSDLRSGSFRPAGRLLVLDRPPTRTDRDSIEQLLAGSPHPLWVVVADDPANPVPLATLMDCVEAWLLTLGTRDPGGDAGLFTLADGSTLRLRTAPLGWRDQDSDRVLVERLASLLSAERTCWLTSDDTSDGARPWAAALELLRRGTSVDELANEVGLDPTIARILLRWRPARARRGLTLMFTGLSGSGKSTIARGVTDWLTAHTDRSVTLLDGDVVRQMLSAGLGFDRAGRVANVRRIGYVAAEVTHHGGVAVCAPIAPYAETREEVRAMVSRHGDFLLVHVNTPLAECERRDLKGLYARARAGDLPAFTGVSDTYDEPTDVALSLDTSVIDAATAVSMVVELLRSGGWLEGRET